MKCLKGILVISFIFTASLYGSVYRQNELPLELWTKMFRITITYNNAFASYKKGETVKFDEIFDDMKCLASNLSVEDGARENYLALIADRKKQVQELKASRQ